MEKYKLCTIREFAEYCADIIINQGRYNSSYCFDAPLPDYDFAIVEDVDKENTLEEIALSAEGWYGLKKLNAGFDNVDMCLIADYYGGGCMKVTSFSGDDGTEYISEAIKNLICASLSVEECVNENTLLIMEIGAKQNVAVNVLEEL